MELIFDEPPNKAEVIPYAVVKRQLETVPEFVPKVSFPTIPYLYSYFEIFPLFTQLVIAAAQPAFKYPTIPPAYPGTTYRHPDW